MSPESSAQSIRGRGPRRRALGRVAFALGVVLVLVPVLVLGLGVAVSAGWQRARLVAWVEARASEDLGVPVRIESIEGPLVSRLSIRGLRVGSADELGVDRVALQWQLWPLLVDGRLEVETAVVSGLGVALERDEDGEWRFPLAALAALDRPDDEDDADLAWRVHSLSIEELTLRLAWWIADERCFLEAKLAGELSDVSLATDRLPTGATQGSLSGPIVGTIVGAPVASGELEVALAPDRRLTTGLEVEGGFGSGLLAARAQLPEPAAAARDGSVPPALDLETVAWEVEQLRLSTPDGVKLAAEGTGTGARFERLSLASSLPDLDRLAAWLELPAAEAGPTLAGSLDVDAELSGSVGAASGVVAARARALVLRGVAFGDVDARLAIDAGRSAVLEALSLRNGATDVVARPGARMRIDGDRLAIEGLTIESEAGALEVSGAVSAEEASGLRFVATGISVDALAALAGAPRSPGGVLDVSLAVDGPWVAPRGEAQLDWRGPARAALRPLDGARLKLELRSDGRQFALDATADVAARARVAVLSASARLPAAPFSPEAWFADGSDRAELSLASIPVAWLERWIPEDLPLPEGRARGALTLTGGTPRPLLVGSLALDGTQGLIVGERVATLAGAAQVPSSPSSLDAWFGVATDHAVLTLDAVSLARLEPWLPAGVRTPDGTARLDLRLEGARPRPIVAGSLEVDGGLVGWDELRGAPIPISGGVRLAGRELVVERVDLGPDGSRASFTGKIFLDDGFVPGSLDLTATFDGFEPSLLDDAGEDPARSNGEIGYGRIHGRMSLTGRVAAPEVEARIDWLAPRWQGFALDRIALDAARVGPLLRAHARVIYQGGELAVLSASLPVPARPTRPLDWLADESARLHLRGEGIDLAMLTPWLPRGVRDPHGVADLDLELLGGRPEPSLRGTFGLANGSLRIPVLRRTFAPITATVSLDRRQVRLQSISIGEPGAQGNIEGTIELEDSLPANFDVRLAFERFPLARSPLLRTDLDGELRLSGPVEAPALLGNLILKDASATVRSETDPAVKEVRILASSAREGTTEVFETAPRGADLFERTTIDVGLAVPRGTWIRGTGIDLELTGETRLDKRAHEPVRVAGELDAVRGIFQLQGRRFDVRRGDLVLDGGSEVDPVIDVEATHRVANVTVIAYLSGRLSDPVLRLESEPAMAEPDIISYLVFGRPADQLGAAEQSNVNLAAAGMAAGLALDELRRTFGDAIPIDTIDARISEESGGSYVEVGKYVSRDVFVRYGHTFGPEAVHEVGVSWRLGDHWMLESSSGSDASAGGDLFWVLEY